MTDGKGRKIDYVRISLTDRCNLRCCYCMPREGDCRMAAGNRMTDEEIIRICRILAGLGIRKVKLTGGEPLLRAGLDRLTERLLAVDGIRQVTLTTNGILLKEQLPGLLRAGISGVNISLDSMDRQLYRKITGRDQYEQALEGLTAAIKESGRLNVKVNMVPMRGINESQILPVASLARNYPMAVRFIEMMPIGLGREYRGLCETEVREILENAFGVLEKTEEVRGNGPARYWKPPAFLGCVGFISAVSHRFCGECDRIRLTADGFLKTCLQYEAGTDLGRLLRENRTDRELEEAVRRAVQEKPAGHVFGGGQEEAELEHRHMSCIGG